MAGQGDSTVLELASVGGGADEPAEAFEHTSTMKDQELLAWIEERKKACLRARQDEEDAWRLAWNFYNGDHWVTWNRGQLVEIPQEDRPHLVANFIQYLVGIRLSHLLKMRPKPDCQPGNSDEESRNASRISVKVLDGVLRRLKWPRKLRRAVLWMLVGGKCFVKVFWDPDAGPRVRDPKTREVARQGDIAIEVAYPYEGLADGTTDDLEHAPYFIHRMFKPMSFIRKRWKTYFPSDYQPDGSSAEGYQVVRELRGLDGTASAQEADSEGEICEVWIRPDGDVFPNGQRAVVVCGKLVERTDTPRGYAAIPFTSLDEVLTNGFWSKSTARGLIDLNKVLNTQISQAEHTRKVLRNKTMIPVQANIDKDAFDQRDDEVVEYWAPYEAKHLARPAQPASDVEQRNNVTAFIKELGGNFDLLSGLTKGETRSGRQTAYQQEYAGVPLGVVAEQIDWAVEDVGNMALDLLQEYATEERIETYVGPNRQAEVIHFRGADLASRGQVVVSSGSSLPMSRMELWDRIETWMKERIIPPMVGLKALNLGDYDLPLFADDELHRENADENVLKLQGLNYDLLRGAVPASQAMATREGMEWNLRYVLRALGIWAFPFDDHAIHLKQLNDALRLTRRYRAMPPTLRKLVDELAEWHGLYMINGNSEVEVPVGSGFPNTLDGVRAMMAQSGGASGSSPPSAAPPGSPPGAGGAGPPAPPAPVLTGSPQALTPGGVKVGPPGAGGAGAAHQIRATGQERAQGLPGVPTPPGPNPTGP